jgi:3-oxoacyl-[acyl-carrier-protein] synthase III
MEVYVSHPTYFIETIKNLGDLSSGGYLKKTEEDGLLLSGVRRYCATTMPLVDMCIRAARNCIVNSRVPPANIDAVIVATTNSMDTGQEFMLMNELCELGLMTNDLISIQWLHCSAFSQTVEMAELMIRFQMKKNVLVILGSKVESDEDRIEPALGTVVGDGAAAFLVGVCSPGLKLVATKTQRDLRVRPPSSTLADPVRAAKSYNALRSVTRSLLERSSLSASELDAIFCTYGSQVYLELAASAAGVDDDKIYSQPFGEYGHVLSCDNVIAMASYIDGRPPSGGKYVLALGWSPHIVGATLLQW